MDDRPFDVLLLPGVVLPADLAYGALLAALGDNARAVVKDLELYAEAEPSHGYDLAVEVGGIVREADAAGFDRFHLAGYSGGGAAALMFAARQPERLLSLALLEPAWAGNDRSEPEERVHEGFRAVDGLPADEQMAAFTRLQLAPGVEAPPRPDGPPPPWLANRRAGIRAILRAFDAGTLDTDALRRFTQPVYFALGGLSNPDYFAQMAKRLGEMFPDFTVETFPERHHFDPPHRSEPEHLAASLLAHWRRAERELPTRREAG